LCNAVAAAAATISDWKEGELRSINLLLTFALHINETTTTTTSTDVRIAKEFLFFAISGGHRIG